MLGIETLDIRAIPFADEGFLRSHGRPFDGHCSPPRFHSRAKNGRTDCTSSAARHFRRHAASSRCGQRGSLPYGVEMARSHHGDRRGDEHSGGERAASNSSSDTRAAGCPEPGPGVSLSCSGRSTVDVAAPTPPPPPLRFAAAGDRSLDGSSRLDGPRHPLRTRWCACPEPGRNCSSDITDISDESARDS